MPDTPEGTIYKGPSGVARDSTWLTSEDLPHDRDVVVTIESVVRRDNVTFQQGRKKPVTLALKFAGRERQLLTNATHRKVLNMLFGTPCAKWFGQRVALYVQQNVRRPDGSEGPAVRIRTEKPSASMREEPKDAEPVGAPASREPGSD